MSVKSHLTYGVSVRPENAATYSAGNEGQKICGDLPETTAFKSYAVKHERKSQLLIIPTYPRSAFSASHTATRQRVPNDCQKHSTLSKTMPTDTATPCWSENWEHNALQLLPLTKNFRDKKLLRISRILECRESFFREI